MRASPNRFERHPRLALAAGVVLVWSLLLGGGEIVARQLVDYTIDFYTPGVARDGRIRYAYGEVPVNSLGFADLEFNLASTKPRVGWFGDSVNYGVGAGFPYRVQSHIRERFPQVEHWNVGGGHGTGLDPDYVEKTVGTFRFDHVVYMLNLNDVLPDETQGSDAEWITLWVKQRLLPMLDWFRDRSYLYNYVRFVIKNALQRIGFEASGYMAYELWPIRHEAVFAAFADKVNALAERLKARGVSMCVILLPYEMQVSRPAAAVYRGLGFQWEDGFEAGSAQATLKRYFSATLHVHDPLPAFAPFDLPVGGSFVYDKGDKIDWNHPNRTGHGIIADSLVAARSCPFLTGPATVNTAGGSRTVP